MTIVYILLAILLFGVLIAIHEFGHFAVAKACGVKVEEFAVGMGPAVWKKQKGETLINSVESLIAEEGRVPDETAGHLYELIDQMRNAMTSDEYHVAYDALLQEYNTLISGT